MADPVLRAFDSGGYDRIARGQIDRACDEALRKRGFKGKKWRSWRISLASKTKSKKVLDKRKEEGNARREP